MIKDKLNAQSITRIPRLNYVNLEKSKASPFEKCIFTNNFTPYNLLSFVCPK